uniref:glutamic acid-rich protein-like n=1 Tax=Semicossyphus pulcher TaxID=241346 RepID=UPI0037E8B463
MRHVTDRPSLKLPFGAFTDLLLHTVVFITLIHSCGGQSRVFGQSQPIVAMVGDDVILPCHLDPVVNAFDMLLEWARPDLDPRFILVRRNGVELESKKHPSFQGRTSVFTEELKHGNASLKLSRVKVSDEGRYRCFILGLLKESTVQLVVGAVSSPAVQVTKNSSEVLLECESKGWYPEPEVFWLDSEGNLLPAAPTETVRGPDELYTVSSRVTVEERHGSIFTCRVTQKKINQTRETHLHVPENKNRRPEDGPEQSEEQKTVTPGGDNTRFQVVVEGEEERAPLMAGREEEKHVDKRGEEDITSQSEPKDQLMTGPEPVKDTESAAGGSETKETNLLILTERETQQTQDMKGGQVTADQEEREQEPTVTPVKDDSGLQMVFVKQPPNLHTDQELQKEEETQQEPVSDVDEKEIKKKKKKKKNRQKKGGSGWTDQKREKENQREHIQLKEDAQREESIRKLQSEIKREEEKDEVEPKRGSSKHLLKDEKQKRSKAEPEKKTEREGEEKLSNKTKKRENVRNQKQQSNQQSEETDAKKDENNFPSASRDGPERPDLQKHQGTVERKKHELHGENGLKEEKEPEEKTERKQEGTKDQPEESNKGRQVESKDLQADIDETMAEGMHMDEKDRVSEQPNESMKAEGKERWEEGSEKDKEAYKHGTQRTNEKIQKLLKGGEEENQQDVQDYERGVQKPEELQQEPRKILRPRRNVKQRIKQQKQTQEDELHEDQQQRVRKRKQVEEDSRQEEDYSQMLKQCQEEQNEDQMEIEEAHQELNYESHEMLDLEQDQEHICYREQEEVMMTD